VEEWNGRQGKAVVYERTRCFYSLEPAPLGETPHFKELGVTAIELMPLAYRGRRNWGHDGVWPYAPDSAYGLPETKALVNAAHAPA
jgi:maltooligosyltrehalose trehalohydrolase